MAITYERSSKTIKYVLNGVLKETYVDNNIALAPNWPNVDVGEIWLGCWYVDDNWWFGLNGLMSEVRVWNKAKTL